MHVCGWSRVLLRLLLALAVHRPVGADYTFDLSATQSTLFADFSFSVSFLSTWQSLFSTGLAAVNFSASPTLYESAFEVSYAQIASAGSSIGFIGFGLETGYSLWWYGHNRSGYEYQGGSQMPSKLGKSRVSPFLFESSDPTYRCPLPNQTGPFPNFTLIAAYADADTGKWFLPAGCWGPYDPRERPWYLSGRANGSTVLTSPFSWMASSFISSQVALRDRDGTLIGVATAAFDLSALQGSLARMTSGREPRPVLFILDLSGQNRVLVNSESFAWINVPATSHPLGRIRNASTELLRRWNESLSFPFISEDGSFWVEATRIESIQGLRLRSSEGLVTWAFVVMQNVDCPPGFHAKNCRQGGADCGRCERCELKFGPHSTSPGGAVTR